MNEVFSNVDHTDIEKLKWNEKSKMQYNEQ